MPENTPNRGYPVPVESDAFEPQSRINALGQAVDADVQQLADDVSDASGINDGAIGPAKLDRAYAESANTFVRIGEDAGANIVSSTSVAIGKEALKTQAAPNDVIAIGEHTLEDGTAIGQGVIAIGGNAARTSSPGVGSVAVGYGAAEYAPDGVQNAVALGRSAQQRASKENAVAVGRGAQLRASGVYSVAVGSAAQSATILMQGGAEYTDLPLDSTRQYFITGTNLLIDGVAWPDGFYDFGTGEESSITADAGTLQVIVYQLDDDSAPSSTSVAGRTPSRDYHTVLGANSATDHTGGIAVGFNAYADTDRQVQIGTAVTVDGVEPPNALRVGVHDAILTTDTPTTGEVLRFDGSAWVADGAATAAQGALADSAVQPGDLQSLADAVDADVEALESRTITAGTGLTGGGDLSANRTLSVDTGGIDTAQLADGAVTPAKSSLGLGFGLGARPTGSRYLTLPGASVASFTAAWERIYMMPLHLWAGTLTRIGIEVVTGQPSAQVRLGIYAARDTDGRPIPAVDPLLDAGAVDASTSGIKEITISHTVTTSGWVYLAAFVYGGSGTGIDLYGLSGAPITPITTAHSLVYGTGTTSALIAFNRPGETSLVQLNEFPSFGHLIPRIVVRY